MVTAPPYLLLYTFTRRQLFVSLSHSSYSIEYYLSGAHCQASNLFMFHNSITVFFSAQNAKSRKIWPKFFYSWKWHLLWIDNRREKSHIFWWIRLFAGSCAHSQKFLMIKGPFDRLLTDVMFWANKAKMKKIINQYGHYRGVRALTLSSRDWQQTSCFEPISWCFTVSASNQKPRKFSFFRFLFFIV